MTHEYYKLVPKEYVKNIEWRRRCLELGYADDEYAREFWMLCNRDILFWVNSFCYTFDPRKSGSTVIPFITYPYQDDAIIEIRDSIERGSDILIEKSRDMGVTWLVLLVQTWMWQFRHYQSFRLVSRVEDLVDKTEDPDSLFWKVDFLIKHQPMWLAPRESLGQTHRTHLHLKNYVTESMIDGASTTGDVARGGRCRALMLDEFAAVDNDQAVLSSVRDVTDCRIFISTHKGTGTAFYRMSKTNINKLRLHWTLHPKKRLGLYQYDKKKDKIELLDGYNGIVRDNAGKEIKFPDDYPFRPDGKIRSPWYDVQCDRASHPMEIAQELDIDPFASDAMFFDPKQVEDIESRDVREPVWTGELIYDDNQYPVELVPNEKGKLRLWVYPDEQECTVPVDSAAMGIDISAGTGASNSATSIGDRVTRTKVAEYVSPDIKPEEYAKLNIALARLFKDAYMIWDGGGPGRIFGDTVIQLGYRNIYYKRTEDSLDKKASMKPGCFLNPAEKLSVLGAYRKALKDNNFIQRSREANQECMQYVFTTGNTVEHAACRNSVDPSGASASHGDRVIADALLNRGFGTAGTPVLAKDDDAKTQHTFFARRQEWEKKNKQLAEKWY